MILPRYSAVILSWTFNIYLESDLIHCVKSYLVFCRVHFEANQGAKNDNSLSYLSDEQRRVVSKGADKMQRNFLHKFNFTQFKLRNDETINAGS